MLNVLKNLFGGGNKIDVSALIKSGAVVLDVRSKGEFASGHARNAMNIPLDQLTSNLSKLKDKDAVIITCCASGMRSASAKSILTRAGYTNVYNAGAWQNVC